jgi:FRG domain
MLPDYEVDSLKNLLDAYEDPRNQSVPGPNKPRKWLFRGQKEICWRLEPALDRALRRFDIHQQDCKSFEERILREGQRNLHRYLTDLPDCNDWAEWFALLQHHGAPTRLLDWSYSFFVTLFFAIDKADPCPEGSEPKPAKIFAIDNEELVGLRKKKYEVGLPWWIRYWHDTNDKDPRVLTYFLKETADLDIVFPLNPFRLNERLAIQQGIFLFCPNRAKSFDEVYKKMRENHPGLTYEIVIHISPSLVAEILTHLQDLNVTSRALFPGIDGFCRGLEHKIGVDKNWTFL